MTSDVQIEDDMDYNKLTNNMGMGGANYTEPPQYDENQIRDFEEEVMQPQDYYYSEDVDSE